MNSHIFVTLLQKSVDKIKINSLNISGDLNARIKPTLFLISKNGNLSNRIETRF